jgi:recombination protein RecA
MTTGTKMKKTDKKEENKDLETALSDIEKKYGEGAIMKLDARPVAEIKSISTTCPSLDLATGIGGVPRGRIVELFGPEMSGKSTTALHIIAEAQKVGGTAAYIDAEHALDPVYAKNLGVKTDELFISQPNSGEEGLEIAEALIRSNKVAVIVIDSVAALVPRGELEGEMGDSLPGLQARLMSQACRKLTAIVAQSNTCLIFINQIRSSIGITWGSGEVTSGGRALKFYASMRLDIRRIGAIKDGDKVIGNRTRVKIVKNKLAPPFRECEFDIIYSEGISREGDILDIATNLEIVDKSGAWFAYKGSKIGQGREKSKQFLKDNPAIMDEISEEIKKVNTKV